MPCKPVVPISNDLENIQLAKLFHKSRDFMNRQPGYFTDLIFLCYFMQGFRAAAVMFLKIMIVKRCQQGKKIIVK